MIEIDLILFPLQLKHQTRQFPPPIHFVIIFLLTTIIAHMQMKCQFIKVSPYDEYKGIVGAIYGSIFSYGMLLIAEYGCEITNMALLSAVKRFSPLLGCLVVVLHMLILHPGFGWFTFILWIISLIIVLLRSIQEIKEVYQCFIHTFEKVGEKIRNLLQNINEEVKNYFHGDNATSQ